MSPFWLIAILPGYALTAGFAGAYIHHAQWHDQGRCNSGDYPPWCILGGFFWPVMIVFAVTAAAVRLGIHAEAMRPPRREEKARQAAAKRKEESRKATAAYEKGIYGKVLE